MASGTLALLSLAVIVLGFSHTAASRTGPARQENVQVLTFVSTCPDPRFTCPNPVEIPAPGKTDQCVPYDPRTSDVRGSFTITWSDSASLPSGTTVAVCSTVHLWTLPSCRGERFTVDMPSLAKVLLEVKSEMAESGELLRLGYSGPWENQASFECVSCGNITTWHTEGEVSEFTGSAELDAALVQDTLASHRISFNSNFFLILGLTMVTFAVVGMVLAYSYSDALSGLTLDQAVGSTPEASAPVKLGPAPSLTSWLEASVVQINPDKLTLVDALKMAAVDLVSSRWTVLLMRATEPFGRRAYGAPTSDAEVPLNPMGQN